MQTYEDLDTLAGGLRTTIDWIVGHNLSLRGEVAEAMSVLRETMDMKCLNEPGRVELISGRIIAALRATASEGFPTQWLDAAIQEVASRPQVEDPPDLDPGSIEAHAPVIVSDEVWVEPPAPPEIADAEEDEDDEDEPSVIHAAANRINANAARAGAYILALQAQLRALGVEPIAQDALDYAQAIAESLVFRPGPSARLKELLADADEEREGVPAPVDDPHEPTEDEAADLGRPPEVGPQPSALQKIDGVTEV